MKNIFSCILSVYLLLFTCSIAYASTNGLRPVPNNVEKVLSVAGRNRPELEKAIAHFQTAGDLFKLKAVYFLIANMAIHSTANYYLADERGKNIHFNEFDYKDYEAASSALSKLRSSGGHIKYVAESIPDFQTVSGQFLIEHINAAVDIWRRSTTKQLPFEYFCEYILPYRTSVEPVQPWIISFNKKYSWFGATYARAGEQNSFAALAKDLNAWFVVANEQQARKEPLPRLGAMQLLFRKLGPCEDVADLAAFIFRSQGIPAAIDMVPCWGTSTGSHFSTSVFNEKMHRTDIDFSRNDALTSHPIPREPAKVIRLTYSQQPGVLASIESAQHIPDSFLRTYNYQDVTGEYWQTSDVRCRLNAITPSPGIAYACVFNGMKWKPVWWGKVANGGAIFSKMSKGVVYLPTFYLSGKILPAGYPVAEGYQHEATLKPDYSKRVNVIVKQESGFLSFRPGRTYSLFYWDNRWILAGKQAAVMSTREMLFGNVPSNSLLLMVPDYSQHKERPFIYTADGTRIWF